MQTRLPHFDLIALQRLKTALEFGVFCLLGALLPSHFAGGATVYSEPVGFLKVTVPPATPQHVSAKLIGVPFQSASVFKGTIASVGSSTITCSSPGWRNNQFSGRPHFLKILSGSAVGKCVLIAANTVDTISCAENSVPVVVGDSFEIFAAYTLAGLLNPPQSPGLTVGGTTAATANLVRLLEGGTWTSYFHNGSNWRTSATSAIQDTTIIAPDNGALIVNQSTGAVSLTLFGAVSTGTEVNRIPSAGQGGFAPRFPVRRSLKDLGIQLCSGWSTAPTASQSDSVLFWSDSGWKVFYHDGMHWLGVGLSGSQDDTVLEPGEAAVVRRRDGAGSSTLLNSHGWFSYGTSP